MKPSPDFSCNISGSVGVNIDGWEHVLQYPGRDRRETELCQIRASTKKQKRIRKSP
jgi:hypothetical protein